MKNNWNTLMDSVVTIQRANIATQYSGEIDRFVQSWSNLSTGVRCFFDNGPTTYEYNRQLGQIAIVRWFVYFNGGVAVQEGDRLYDGTKYFLVEEVNDYTSKGFGVVCRVVQKNYAMS